MNLISLITTGYSLSVGTTYCGHAELGALPRLVISVETRFGVSSVKLFTTGAKAAFCVSSVTAFAALTNSYARFSAPASLG